MRLFNFKKKQKPVVITIHGFGKRMHHQFDSISDFLRKNGYDVIQFDLFDYNNYQDVDYKIWIERAEQQVREAQKKYHNNIVLFGYSFNIADLRELEIGLKQLEGNINLLKRY